MEYERRKAESKLKLYNTEIERLSSQLTNYMENETPDGGVGVVKATAIVKKKAAPTSSWLSPIGFIANLFYTPAVEDGNFSIIKI